MRYFGILNGTNLAPAGIHDRGSVLVLESLQHAQYHLQGAISGSSFGLRYWGARNLDGEYPGDIPGGSGDDSTLMLYTMPERVIWMTNDPRHPFRAETDAELWQRLTDNGDPYPDYVLSVGPRGGIRTERA